MTNFHIRPLTLEDETWAARLITDHSGNEMIVVHGKTYYPHKLLGFIATHNKERVGLITYRLDDDGCEIMSLHSLQPGIGIGTALIETVKQAAVQAACKRLWLITTNDNLNALGFYQKRGFELVAIHRHAVTKSRRIKPEIPLIGFNNIPLRDEIELELVPQNYE